MDIIISEGYTVKIYSSRKKENDLGTPTKGKTNKNEKFVFDNKCY